MTNEINTLNQPLSHDTSTLALTDIVVELKLKIQDRGDLPYASIDKQLSLLAELCEFELGRFLLQNKGLNGYWIDYIVTYPMRQQKTDFVKPSSWLLKKLLEDAPIVRATQQRFQIFLQQNQQALANNMHCASLPCGRMGELLYLAYADIESINLYGMDIEQQALNEAQALAATNNLSRFCQFILCDAWAMNAEFDNKFDLISSTGLTLYVASDEKVIALYQQLYKMLKPGGTLVTSYITPAPTAEDAGEWDFNNIVQEDLMLQKIIFKDIIDVKWQYARSTAQTKAQLHAAGFSDCQVLFDEARMFPTVIVRK